VVPHSPRHELDRTSRLNYACLYAVEYNVKVWFIGKVHKDFESELIRDYNCVQEQIQERNKSASLDQYQNLDPHSAGMNNGLVGSYSPNTATYTSNNGYVVAETSSSLAKREYDSALSWSNDRNEESLEPAESVVDSEDLWNEDNIQTQVPSTEIDSPTPTGSWQAQPTSVTNYTSWKTSGELLHNMISLYRLTKSPQMVAISVTIPGTNK
jgi:hypothetical protein